MSENSADQGMPIPKPEKITTVSGSQAVTPEEYRVRLNRRGFLGRIGLAVVLAMGASAVLKRDEIGRAVGEEAQKAADAFGELVDENDMRGKAYDNLPNPLKPADPKSALK